MSLTLAQLRTLQTNFLANDLDNYAGESPSNADQLTQVNWALRAISKRCFLYDVKVTLTLVSGQLVYNLRDITTPTVSKRIVKPERVVINSVPLLTAKGREYGLWSLNELTRQYSTWQTDTTGTPILACYKGNNELIVYPAPTATVVSNGNSWVEGQILAPDLSGDSDVPAINEEAHECIAYLAAIKAAEPVVTESEGMNRIGIYAKAWTEVIEEIRTHNINANMAWGETSGQYENDFLIC